MNTNLGGAFELPAAFEQHARGVEIHAHSDIEVRLGLPADDGGQMEYRIGVGRDGAFSHGGVGQVAGHRCDAAIVEPRGRGHIQQYDRRDLALLSARVGERAALEQLAGEAAAEETAAAGDHDTHGSPRQ